MKKKKYENGITEEERKTQDMSAVADYDGSKSSIAKRLEGERDDYDDTPVRDTSFSGRIKNFWYHYKWGVIIAAFVIVVAAVGIKQIGSKESFDLSVMYAGSASIEPESAEEMRKTFCSILTKDIDGDGKKNVYLRKYRYCSPAEMAAIKDEAEKKGLENGIDEGENASVYNQISDMMFVGECGVMFLGGHLYDEVKNAGGLEVLSDVLGYAPEKQMDETGIRLGDTDAYKYFDTLKVMPADTIVCMRKLSTAGGIFTSEKETAKVHDSAAVFLSDFLGFKAQ